MDQLPRIGDEFGKVKPPVFELVLTDHIEPVDPQKFGLDNVDSIDPAGYFITSGDAVEKARALKRDYLRLAGKIRRMLYKVIAKHYNISYREAVYYYNIKKRTSTGLAKYEAALWKAAGRATKLYNTLDRVRGNDCFLETEWDEDHRLRCIPKNPRGPAE